MNLRPTIQRGFGSPDHRPPTGKHAGGREQSARWKGTSRTIDRAAKRKANRRSWRKLLDEGRSARVAERRQP